MRTSEEEDDLEHDLNRSALWAVTYGDVMSYLMVFFLMMFAFTFSRSISTEASMKALEAQFGKTAVDVEGVFSKEGIPEIARMTAGEESLRLSMRDAVLFDEGKAELKASARPQLQRLARAFLGVPNLVQVEGHTDNIPPGPKIAFRSNWELSAARAFAVLRFFLDAGIPAERLSGAGYGEFRPAASNDTAEGRASNRRIEINVLRRRGEARPAGIPSEPAQP